MTGVASFVRLFRETLSSVRLYSAKVSVMRACCFLLLVCGVALCEVVQLDATQDAMIWEANPGLNYGNSFISSSYESGWAPSLIQFDVSSYAGVTLNSATLEMYCYSTFTVPDTVNVVYRLTSAWSEGNVCWSNAPDPDSTLSATFPKPPANSWISCDVTALVETWLNGSFTNNGLVFGRVNPGNGGVDIRSREFGNQTYRPRLVLDFVPLSLESATFGCIKATF